MFVFQGVVTPTLPTEPFATVVKIPVKRSSRFLALVKRSRQLGGRSTVKTNNQVKSQGGNHELLAESIQIVWSVLIHQSHPIQALPGMRMQLSTVTPGHARRGLIGVRSANSAHAHD